MHEQIQYHLAMSAYDKYFPVAICSLLTIIGGVILVNFTTMDVMGIPFIFMILWLAILGYNWMHVAKFPIEMWVTSEHIVILRDRLSRTVRIPMNDFYAIKFSQSMLTIKTRHGTFRGMGSFTGFSQFVEDLRSQNPSISIQGC